MLAVVLLANVQIAAAAAATPSPSPTATPRFTLKVSGSNVFVDQATGGPGTTPPKVCSLRTVHRYRRCRRTIGLRPRR